MGQIHDDYLYERGYILTNELSLGDLPETLDIQGFHLLRRSEFHISLVCTYKIANLIDASQKDRYEAEIVTFFSEYTQSNPLNTYAPTGEYRLVKNGDRVTLIAMVTVPGIEEFFAILRQKYSVDIPLQPTHITIYTLQPEKGIGIFSHKQLEHESEIVEAPLNL
jgi:hypothetical protein